LLQHCGPYIILQGHYLSDPLHKGLYDRRFFNAAPTLGHVSNIL
jgi:hypothetical protein